MRFYHAIVHKDADSAFGVTFPDLPGCFSAADEMEDVLSNAVEALELWFQDQPDVVPSSMDAMREQCAADLADGAFLIAVPHYRTAGRVQRVNLSLDRGTVEAIDAAASSRGLTRSAFLAEAARNEIAGRH